MEVPDFPSVRRRGVNERKAEARWLPAPSAPGEENGVGGEVVGLVSVAEKGPKKS